MNQTATTFEDLGLSPSTLQALEKKGFKTPSPIQQEVIPFLLANNQHLMAQAQTGTGKTAAFGIPLIEKISSKTKHTCALILTPTRELCTQVCAELVSFAQSGLNIIPIYGGQSMTLQLKKLKQNPHIIVGTPGRVIDHIKRKTLQIDKLDFLVLDEADEMLSMGFLPDIEMILEHANQNKPQIFLFSATFSPNIKKLSRKYLPDHKEVLVTPKEVTTTLTRQIYYQVAARDKFEILCRIIESHDEFFGIIFCTTKINVQQTAQRLLEKGYSVGDLHGDLSQAQRELTLKKLKRHQIKILVATDVAARGIDVVGISHVVNYELPQDPEAYIHRIGRTGRAGTHGEAISLVSRNEHSQLMLIKKVSGASIEKEDLPSIEKMIEKKHEQILAKIENLCLNESDSLAPYEKIAAQIEELSENKTLALKATLKHFLGNTLDKNAYQSIEDAPAFQKGGKGGTQRLFIAFGKKQGANPHSLIELLQKHATIASKDIDRIMLLDDFSFATVPIDLAHLIIKSERKTKGNQKPLISLAKEEKAPMRRNSRPRRPKRF